MRSAEAGTKNDSFELYLTLDENERALVELTAVLTAGTARTKLAAALRTLRVYESGTKPYTGKSLLSVIERLATKGVLAWDGSHARCHPAVIERVNRHLAAEGSFDAMAEAARVAVPLMRHTYRRQFHSREEAIREVRIAMYRHNESLLAELVDACSNTFPITASQPHPLVQICQNPFDGQWLVTFPPSIVECVVAAWLESGISILCPVGDVLPFLREWPLPSGQGGDARPDAGLDLLAAELHLLRGEFDDVRRAAAEYGNHAIVATLEAAVELLTGDTQAALAQYEKAYEAVKKKTRKRKVYLPYFSGLLHVLALLKAGDAESLARAEAVARAGSEDRKNYWQSAYHVLQQIVALRTVGIESSSNHRSHALYLHEDWLCVLLGGLLTLWQDRPEQDDVDITATRLAELQRVSAASGYTWLAAEAADVASRLQDRAAAPAGEHAAFREQSGAVGLVEVIPYQEPWQRALDALLLVRRDPSGEEKKEAPADARMVWLVDCNESQRWYRVAPLLQKRTQRGWTKGRNVSLKRLRLDPDMLDCLTHQDRRICE
ncbi:MAG TPA: hypothetical protein VMX74_00675, partial [Pirellulales bacterium]|nr:hypothetical protein [Pirellulales bacterium]